MMAELKGGGLAWGINMSADALSNEMIAFLLRVLENVENAADDLPISTLQKPADVQFEAQSKTAAFADAVDRSENRLVERIATAMSKNFEFKPA
jgi:hypothetical protein